MIKTFIRIILELPLMISLSVLSRGFFLPQFMGWPFCSVNASEDKLSVLCFFPFVFWWRKENILILLLLVVPAIFNFHFPVTYEFISQKLIWWQWCMIQLKVTKLRYILIKWHMNAAVMRLWGWRWRNWIESGYDWQSTQKMKGIGVLDPTLLLVTTITPMILYSLAGLQFL